MMKTSPFLLFAVVILCSCGQSGNPEKQPGKDSLQAMKESMDHIPSATVDFITDAATANLKEIRLGQLAKKKATDDRIRQYGAMMEKDHQVANEQLQVIANKAGVTMPADLTAAAKETEETLINADKEEFDKAYIRQMIKDHKATIVRFNTATASQDTAISTFAKEVLPQLNKHLDEADRILENMRKQINKSESEHAKNQ